MTKLFPRTFAPLPSDAERDRKLSEKIAALQRFVKPQQLDIPDHFQREASWLLAQKELQKMGSYKAPRDKLVCVLNCCRVINNLLLNAAVMAAGGDSDASPPGADEFLPVLIYVLLQANPPQLFSTIDYIQRYRHQTRLVSEASYFFTNLVSAASFLENANHTSLSMTEEDFNSEMSAAQAALLSNSIPDITSTPAPATPQQQPQLTESSASASVHSVGSSAASLSTFTTPLHKEASKSPISLSTGRKVSGGGEGIGTNGRSISAGSAAARRRKKPITEADIVRDFPFAFAQVGDLRVKDVELLLADYKELVLKYTALARRVQGENVGPSESLKAPASATPASPPTSASTTDGTTGGVASGTETATTEGTASVETVSDFHRSVQNSSTLDSTLKVGLFLDSSKASLPNRETAQGGSATALETSNPVPSLPSEPQDAADVRPL
eukprot:TRINITY_DN767_c0_g1_i1.p1 TRINITY_DN767_c0_g1~~TRINITY_DN767_c0_g1_i1.p1  ORF type:complete len:442 (+),score=86.85 TRINITY_DN767_c0_g1_i1:81-1406(+)